MKCQKKDALASFIFYKGLFGKKSLGKQLSILAISFKCLILYFAFYEGASISEINVVLFPNARDKETWAKF